MPQAPICSRKTGVPEACNPPVNLVYLSLHRVALPLPNTVYDETNSIHNLDCMRGRCMNGRRTCTGMSSWAGWLTAEASRRQT